MRGPASKARTADSCGCRLVAGTIVLHWRARQSRRQRHRPAPAAPSPGHVRIAIAKVASPGAGQKPASDAAVDTALPSQNAIALDHGRRARGELPAGFDSDQGVEGVCPGCFVTVEEKY